MRGIYGWESPYSRLYEVAATRSHMYGCIENVEENVWGFLPLLTRAFLASCFRQHIFKTLQ